MMKTKSIPEILKECEELKTSKERVAFLKSNDTTTLRQIVYSAFHPDVDFIFPKTRPDYTVNPGPVGVCETHLYREARKLKYFITKFVSPQTKTYKLENTFIEMLESVHETEAELLLQICVDRKLKTKIKYKEVQQAFPEMLPEVKPKPRKSRKKSS